MDKPSYSSTKRYLMICSLPAWAVILLITWSACIGNSSNAVAYAQIALPIMAGLLVSLLGIHRGFGSLDYATTNRSRDSPADGATAAVPDVPQEVQ